MRFRGSGEVRVEDGGQHRAQIVLHSKVRKLPFWEKVDERLENSTAECCKVAGC